MFFSIVYEVALWLLTLIALPKMLYQRFKYGKYRESLTKKFGIGFPHIEKGDHPLVWIHGVSVGETKAVAALAKTIKAQPNNPIVIISTGTETGQAEARRSIPEADYHVYLPFDFYGVITPILNQVRPDTVLFCEGDLWYNFLRAAKNNGAHIAIVSGKMSERSASRYSKFPLFSRLMFGMVDLICLQSVHYKSRFEALGIPQDKIVVTGNIKFDDTCPMLSPSDTALWRQSLGIRDGDPVLVVGSTHDPEEKIVLDALETIWKKIPNLKVLLVPRHPERFPAVATLLAKEGCSFTKFSALGAPPPYDSKVILVDAMGMLRKCYQIADVAIVAGSYTPRIGGHNILEPSWYGVPVVFGPYMNTQPELVELMLRYKAGLQVSEEALLDTLQQLFQDEGLRKQLGENGRKLTSDNQGATARTLESLRNRKILVEGEK